MSNNTIEDHIAFAGDYDCKHIFLHDHEGDKTDIKQLVDELNIYESIYKNAMTGSVVITDAQNLITKLQIQGIERISFVIKTPGTKGDRDIINASEESGHPFHIYKITDRVQVAPGTLRYVLHFGSREFMRNIRTKVSQAYDGRLDRAVYAMFLDENYLDSRKTLTFEPCGNSDKIVIPNMRPFDAINMIARRALPEKSNGVGYYFYETTKGYHFRSWENMCVSQGRNKRPTKQTFYYAPINVKDDPAVDNKIEYDYKLIDNYEFITNIHDTAANTALGTYGHRVISYNFFDKSFTEEDYNYHNQFALTRHTDSATSQFYGEKYAVGESNVDETIANQKTQSSKVSDYPESRVSLQPTTQFTHNTPEGSYGIDVLEDGRKLGQEISQKNQVLNGTTLKLTVKGQSYIEAGDVIEFKMRAVDEKNPDGQEDPQFSGRYIITKVRHKINPTRYDMILECSKDSVKTGYTRSYKKIAQNKNIATLRDAYQVEKGDSYGSL